MDASQVRDLVHDQVVLVDIKKFKIREKCIGYNQCARVCGQAADVSNADRVGD